MLAGAAQAQTKEQPNAQTAAEQTTSDEKPNILFIMDDDIGFMQPRIYHRGLMVGETPNIDRIGQEGAIFIDYVAMQSCTSGRNAFLPVLDRLTHIGDVYGSLASDLSSGLIPGPSVITPRDQLR
jgi:hypothetical protein